MANNFWDYYCIAQDKKTDWIYFKSRTSRRLEALEKIATIVAVSQIAYIADFLNDRDDAIRNLAYTITKDLFEQINSKQNYYECLNKTSITIADIDFYERVFSKGDLVLPLCIASMSGNGFLREYAVRKLAESNTKLGFQFILYRLGDWVVEVRTAARIALEKFKCIEYRDLLIENLTTLDWLKKVRRVNLEGIYAEITQYIFSENIEYIIHHYCSYNDKLRILIARFICEETEVSLNILRLFLRDKNLVVRDIALQKFSLLDFSDIDRLLHDSSPRIRLGTMFKLKGNDRYKGVAKNFLADDAALIRECSRYALMNDQLDFSLEYHKNLLDNAQIIGSLNGLGETNAKQYLSSLLPYLKHPKSKVKVAAFLGLKKLAVEQAYNFALENLDTESIRLRKIIIEFLSGYSEIEILEKARNLFQTGDIRMKMEMLKLLKKIGRMPIIGDLMLGTIDSNETIKVLSLQYIAEWKLETNCFYLKKDKHDIERATSIFEKVATIYKSQNKFEGSALDGLDFYLK